MTFDRQVLLACGALALFVSAQVAYRTVSSGRANDMYFPICAGQSILRSADPYAGGCTISDGSHTFPTNPLTAVVVALPFARFGYLGAIVLWSCCTALLVFGILRTGEPWRLLLFTSAPFWYSFSHLQWSSLLTALLYFPALLPLALVKPHVGLPIVLTHLTPKRLLGCVIFLAGTFIVDNSWLVKWLPQTMTYDGFVPYLVLPVGPLVLGFAAVMLLRNPTDWRPRFFVLMGLAPQRSFYDAMPLGALATSPRDLLAWSALSWCGYAIGALSNDYYPLAVVAFIYLPVAIGATTRRLARTPMLT